MAYKIDISIIVKEHIKTLVNDNTGKPDFRDVFFFGLFPIVFAVYMVHNKVFIDKDFINGMISGLSIYVGLSLNLIVLIFEISQKDTTTSNNKSILKEIVANVSFSILLSIGLIISTLFTLINNETAKCISHGLAYFLLVHMFLIVLMLIKRMYYQIINQI